MASKFHSSLSQDLLLMLNDADDHNVIVQVGGNQNVKEFRAHSNILRARSPYFKNALSSRWITKNNGMMEFKKPNINPAVFDMILKYMYTGEVDLTVQTGENILGLLVASDELLLEELFQHVQDHLIEKQTTWVQQNFVLVLHTVFKLSSCKKLQDHCLESICVDPQPFITSKEFPSLDKDILYGLLKRDDLVIDEIVAWDHLIKWGIEQTPGLGSKNRSRSKWNIKNYEALKKTLDKFIPLIRFSEISSADFFDKVRPYKAVIPHHIYEEVMKFYMKGSFPKTTTLPPRIGKIQIESNIIKPKIARTIINWIEKKDAKAIRNKSDSLYKFDRVYQGSKSGIDYNSFKNQCGLNSQPMLVLVKCQNSQKIFGGYTPVGFYNTNYNYNYGRNNVNQWINSADSFIFSFENDDMKNTKLSRVTSHGYAVYNNYYDSYNGYDSGYGFNFGSALYLQYQNLYSNNSGYYENNINDNNSYSIEEIEAFNVVKQ